MHRAESYRGKKKVCAGSFIPRHLAAIVKLEPPEWIINCKKSGGNGPHLIQAYPPLTNRGQLMLKWYDEEKTKTLVHLSSAGSGGQAVVSLIADQEGYQSWTPSLGLRKDKGLLNMVE